MGKSVRAILVGLVLAIFSAALVAKIFGLQFAESRSGEVPVWHVLRTCLPIAAYALPGALVAILLAEERRIRGLSYWLFIGLLLSALAFFTLVNAGPQVKAAFLSSRTFSGMMVMGMAAGLIYWMISGRKSGHLLTALTLASQDEGMSEYGLRNRCRYCTALGLLLGLLPLTLLGWYMIYRPAPMLPASIAAAAAADGTKILTDAGLPWAKLEIENHVGHISGTAADEAGKSSGYETAKAALAPMVGIPGVIAYLQNDITVPEAVKVPPPVMADDSAVNAKASKHEKRKTEEAAAAQRKAEENTRLAAEAKQKAEDDMAAKEKAKAAEVARLAAEAKRKASEEIAAQKAKAAAEARAEAEAKKREDDQKRLADELAAQKKADEQARLAAEAEAERRAVEAAHKAEADKRAAEAEAKRQAEASAVAKKLADAQGKPHDTPAPPAAAASPLPAPDAKCPGDFSELFRSTTIRFGLRSAEIAAADADFLDRIAAVATRCAGYSLSISGHTDRNGARGFNQQLSLDRATAVRDALAKRGIAPDRMDAQGYAAERPFDPANKRTSYALNRRVDFGASLTAAGKATAAGSITLPLTSEQCGSEFSRAFLSDTIRFAGNSAGIADRYASFLDRIAALSQNCPAFMLSIGGHADRRGAAAANQKLSERRAGAVRDALMDRGVSEDRMSSSGYAGGRPFDPGNTPAAYALNRRVDFGVVQHRTKN